MVFSKMLAKGMHLTEFENCIFVNFWRGNYPSETSEREHPSDTHFLNFQRFIKVLTKASKQEKWEDFQTW